jgi:predicted component of type VI protein secretion system
MKNFFFLTITLIFLTGCMQTKNATDLTIQIRSEHKTNNGTPLYMVVKETTMSEFLMEDYHNISTQAFWKEENPNELLKKHIIPGSSKKIHIPIHNQDKSIGIYFIFTNPGECWKYLVDHPQSKRVKILLGGNQYQEINIYDP